MGSAHQQNQIGIGLSTKGTSHHKRRQHLFELATIAKAVCSKKSDKVARLRQDELRAAKRQKVSGSKGSSPKKARAVVAPIVQQANALFDQFRDGRDGEDANLMTDDNIIRFFEALEVDISDLVVLVLSWQMGAKTMCTYTRDEFTTGVQRLGCGSIEKLKSHLPSLSAQLFDPDSFQDFYSYVYKYACEEGKKTIPTEEAIELWKLVLTDRFHFLDEWLAFVQTNAKEGISRDVWSQLAVFHKEIGDDLSKFDEDGAWPVLIDEFVESLQKDAGSK